MKVKATTTKKTAVLKSSQPEPVFDDLLQDFVSNGHGQVGKPSTKNEETSIFDDFLTGQEHDINHQPVKSGFAGWLGEEAETDVKVVEEEKGNVWVPGGSNLIDISNPL